MFQRNRRGRKIGPDLPSLGAHHRMLIDSFEPNLLKHVARQKALHSNRIKNGIAQPAPEVSPGTQPAQARQVPPIAPFVPPTKNSKFQQKSR